MKHMLTTRAASSHIKPGDTVSVIGCGQRFGIVDVNGRTAVLRNQSGDLLHVDCLWVTHSAIGDGESTEGGANEQHS